MAEGEKTTPFVAVPTEALQVYELAPLPFTVMVCVLQITDELDAALTTGSAFTVTVTAAMFVLVQPAVLVPTTE